jgi:protein-tyrosine phosphatase
MAKLPILESYWVEENSFLAGEYPGGYDLETTRRRMDAFLQTGVYTFIDLTHSNERMPYVNILQEQGEVYGVNPAYHQYPIRDRSVPSAETMTAILDSIDEAIENGSCVYVHCWGGVGRTGLVVGCYLVRHGNSNEQALALVNKLYKTRPKNPFLPRSPETDEQVEFVLNWWDEPKNNQKFCEG